MHETEAREVCGTFPIDLWRNGYVVVTENDILGLRDPLLEQRRRDGALVDIKESHIVVGGFMKKDDELDEIGVRLLPERLLATAEQVV
jgi:hypothetical protein